MNLRVSLGLVMVAAFWSSLGCGEEAVQPIEPSTHAGTGDTEPAETAATAPETDAANVATAGDVPEEPEWSVGTGTLTGNLYRHEFFGMTATLPEGWSIVHEDDTGESTTGESAEGLAEVYESEPLLTNMFMVFEFPLEEGRTHNASLACTAIDVSQWPSMHRKEGYIAQVRLQLMAGRSDIVCSDVLETEKIGGRTFAFIRYEISMETGTGYGRNYAIVQNGQALSIALTYGTDEQEAALDAILATVRFD